MPKVKVSRNHDALKTNHDFDRYIIKGKWLAFFVVSRFLSRRSFVRNKVAPFLLKVLLKLRLARLDNQHGQVEQIPEEKA